MAPLFVAEGSHGIDAGGAAGRPVTGEEAGGEDRMMTPAKA